jgi:hypothetical protein
MLDGLARGLHRARRALLWVPVGALGLSLSGCVALDPSVQASAAALWPSKAEVAAPRLNPNFDYLRVTVQGQVLYLARGYTDADPAGPVSVWYSSDREVLRLQRGRLAGLAGTPVSWVHVRGLTQAPVAWPGTESAVWQREVDHMPGYRWGLRDQLVVRAIAAPVDTALSGWLPQALQWAEEQDQAARLPPARYAWAPGQPEPIYGEQCLHTDFCLTWQRWSAQGAVPTPP